MKPSESYNNPYLIRKNISRYYQEIQYIDQNFHSDVNSSILQVYLCSFIQAAPDPGKKQYSMPKKWSMDFHWIVIYILSGSGTVETKEERKPVKTGDVIIRKPNIPLVINPDKGETIKQFVLYLVDSPITVLLCDKDNHSSYSICHLENQQKAVLLTEKMKAAVVSDTPDVRKNLSVLAYSFLAEVDDFSSKDILPGNFERILFAIRQAPQHYKGISSLMKEFGLSRRKLYKMFAEYVHTTPMQYLIAEKLDKSRWYLIHSTYSLQYIAKICGYNSLSFYSKEFKKKYLLSPEAYRKRHREIST